MQYCIALRGRVRGDRIGWLEAVSFLLSGSIPVVTSTMCSSICGAEYNDDFLNDLFVALSTALYKSTFYFMFSTDQTLNLPRSAEACFKAQTVCHLFEAILANDVQLDRPRHHQV